MNYFFDILSSDKIQNTEKGSVVGTRGKSKLLWVLVLISILPCILYAEASPVRKVASQKTISQTGNAAQETSGNLAAHFRFSSSVPLSAPADYFQKKEELFAERLKGEKGKYKMSPAEAALSQKAEADSFEKFIKPADLKSCDKSSTVRIPHDEEKKDKARMADQLPNLLILKHDAARAKESLAYDFPAFFGSKTSILYYSDKPGDTRSWQLSKNGLVCLPARLRVTKDETFLYYGSDALKNYDEPLSANYSSRQKTTRQSARTNHNVKKVPGKSRSFIPAVHPVVKEHMERFW